MSDSAPNTRRDFLSLSGAAAAGLIVIASPVAVAAQAKPKAILSTGTDLGSLIVRLSPYTFAPPPPGKDLFTIQEDGVEYQEKPGAWYFKGAAHNLARSVRIPYTFYWKNPAADAKADPIEIRDYFLIGFEGGGAY